jgi:TIR domain
MKVFISWSGAVSRDVAVALRDWLPLVIQAVRPYVSSEDIDPGVRWSGDIAVQLDATDFGILCVTRDNVTTPWLNFEAGALSKSVEKSRVVPFLFDLGPSDVPRGPLAQFQAVQPTRMDVLRLIRGMNEFCSALPAERLEGTVDVWWPHLEQRLQEIQEQMKSVKAVGPQRSTDDMLAELLELTRGLQRELQVVRDTRVIPGYRLTTHEERWQFFQQLRDFGYKMGQIAEILKAAGLSEDAIMHMLRIEGETP